eukprot:g15428.t1
MQRIASFLPQTGRNFFPKTGKRVCIIGAGGSGMFAAERLRHLFDVTVVDPKSYYEFSPGLPRALVQPWSVHKRITFDYRKVLEDQLGVEFVQGYVTSLTRAGSNRNPAASSASSAPGGGQCVVGGGAGGGGASASSSSSRTLDFDYCIVCTGVQNGIWKQNFATLEERLEQFRAVSSKLSESEEDQLSIVGGGLVGTEVAAEISHFWPRKRLSVYDGNPRLLFQLPPSASKYAQDWLQKRGVALRMAEGFEDYERRQKDADVISCVGAKATNGFLAANCLDERGFVTVNRQLQVLQDKARESPSMCAPGEKMTSTPAAEGDEEEAVSSSARSPSSKDAGGTGATSSSSSGSTSAPNKLQELAPVPGWYACGDCVALAGVPKTMFVAEEMASVVVANIERSEGFAPDILDEILGATVSPSFTSSAEGGTSSTGGAATSSSSSSLNDFDAPAGGSSGSSASSTRTVHGWNQISDELSYPFCVSLGPMDGLFSQVDPSDSSGRRSAVLLDGRAAALQKQLIEDTKMLALTEKNLYAKMFWAAVH